MIPSTVIASTIVNGADNGACATVCINNRCQSSCEPTDNSHITKGLGAITQRPFTVEQSFHSINLTGLNATIRHGKSWSINASGYDNILNQISLTIDSGLLSIALKPGSYENADTSIDIVLPQLSLLDFQGGNKVKVEGFSETGMRINLSGSNTLKSQKNTVRHLTINAQGSNQIDWLDNNTSHFSIHAAGTNTVSIKPSKHKDSLIDGQISGINEILLCGNPKNDVTILGLSSIKNIAC